MNERLKTIAIPALRWTLGVVVLWQSAEFAFSAPLARHFAQAALPQWIRPALAGSEIVAALLFLLPAASLAGGLLLLLVFAAAIAIHLRSNDFEVGGLLVYAMAAIVCMTHAGPKGEKATRDRG